ncbi:MAG: hypothetical protein H7Y20_02870 [Bryobacteraceae bacterium]|nr:hypothetical protein [Bryobacteraceae bacterium]
MDRSSLARHLVQESTLRQQLEREYLPTGISDFDEALGGLPRGAVTEIYGPATSGKTSFLTSFLARATALGEFCALIDGTDSFDPASAKAAHADLARLLWVRCHRMEEAVKSADLLVHSGGWGLVILNLTGIPPQAVRKIPMSWWYRFRRAVEHTPTAFVVLESEPFVKNCAIFALEFPQANTIWSGTHRHFRILKGAGIRVSPRKPVQSREAGFEARFLAV